jgi:hypothetical protein
MEIGDNVSNQRAYLVRKFILHESESNKWVYPKFWRLWYLLYSQF